MFLWKGVLKICSKFTGEHPCLSATSINLQSNFIEITLRHGCSPVNLLHIFRTVFLKNTYEWLLPMVPFSFWEELNLKTCSLNNLLPIKMIFVIFASSLVSIMSICPCHFFIFSVLVLACKTFCFCNKIAKAQPHLSHVSDFWQIHFQNISTVCKICLNSTLKIGEWLHLKLIWYLYC